MIIDFNTNYEDILPVNTRILAIKKEKEYSKKRLYKKNSIYEGKLVMKNFGVIKSGNKPAYLFTLTNKNGTSVDLTNLGATIVSIRVADRNGKIKDIVQGYNSAESYTDYPVGHAGGTIGPCANKIDYGTFEINGQKYDVEKNKDNGRTHCHGASNGFDIKNWEYEINNSNEITFTYTKKEGEGGYPGNVVVKVTYNLTDNDELKIIYTAETDKDTVLNLTNHSYFNLDGEENAKENSILNHIVKLPNSSKYTINSEVAVPTGEIKDVDKSPFDFREARVIADRINSEDEQLKIGSGYDQNYCIDGYDGKSLIDIAEIKSDLSGIVLKVSTNLPGFQFYTANHLGKASQPLGKSEKRYEKRSALCIEPQFYPNAINIDNFEKPLLKKGEKYNRIIKYTFVAE